MLNEAETAALQVILTDGPSPRAEIARAIGMSRASLTRVTRRLLEVGLVTEGAVELRGWTGRPSELLGIRRDAFHLFGVKLTGETAFATVTDLAGDIVWAESAALIARDVASVVDQIAELLAAAASRFADIASVGICIAGDVATVAGRELVIDSAFLGWNEVPLHDILARRLELPVVVQNDVRALTAAEHLFGAGAGAQSFALVTVGAGIGFGFTIHGQVVSGTTGHAGRVDHLPVDLAGPICGLGHRGCASAYLPTNALLDSMGSPRTDYDSAVDRARSGDPSAVRAFHDAGRALGRILGTIGNFLDPDRIVVTGDGLAVVDLAERQIHEAIAEVRVPLGAATPFIARPFEFTQWARAGAINGLLTLLANPSDTSS